ncbi:hypothetical protein K490DRAFT_36749 [Saccharata proteae CBS 121410]|uniref:Formin GTPase-binding domain-containing protein n=1 Tax=Saccharata proteae CBS 121410 TaxID=1314787 RepID=A0A6A5YCI6_9PEZI|nr:hypothetical protein K490DRAFT_36749 [Saccharata proteae CBS 121410]
MDSLASPQSERPGHKRNKSASTIRNIFGGKGHKRNASNGSSLPALENAPPPVSNDSLLLGTLLPPDHPHSKILSEMNNQPNNAAVPRKSKDSKEHPLKGLHKKTMSSVSLRSLANKDKDKEKSEEEAKEKRRSRKQEKVKKTKSTTSLSAVFSKSKPGKEKPTVDKENTTPPTSAVEPQHTPIWAEFATQKPADAYHEITTTTTIPLSGVDDEIARYTPAEYSPSKQHSFYEQPALRRPRSNATPRSSASGSRPSSFIESISRKISDEHKSPEDIRTQDVNHGSTWRARGERIAKKFEENPITRRSGSKTRKASDEKQREGIVNAHKKATGSRVMAAVAAINGRRNIEPGTPLDPEKIDIEFEAVLESRNIPENLREKMRSLSVRVKADFIAKNKVEEPQSSIEPTSRNTIWTDKRASTGQSIRQTSTGSQPHESATESAKEEAGKTEAKRSRPRSGNFTFGRSDKAKSPAKKRKSEEGVSNTSSTNLSRPNSSSTKSLGAASGSQVSSFFGRAPKPEVPEDYVAYLRKVHRPQDVEVGKLHKLRILLRNETVAWVDSFIRQGGMSEIVGLLHRIMKIEWREEHEDTLLHESLLCLKGLCTTDLALQELCDIEATLFPELLAMLFDKEHKGPSEFTTRGLIISLLYAHLSAAPPTDLASRARTILGYLRDPQKPEDDRPVPFILDMHQSRPYRVWCTEVSNVTKEVFWIFLHHLNVIPLAIDTIESSDFIDSQTFTQQHFPQPRPPVPAAPYVGGVEWDATNYISTHLDLMNGILASLPTPSERNNLRAALRVSGFEKIMACTLRTCKEKFYGAVHDGLKTWIRAAAADGWAFRDVRMGLEDPKTPSPKKQSPKKQSELAPQLDAPKMELPSLGLGKKMSAKDDDMWI